MDFQWNTTFSEIQPSVKSDKGVSLNKIKPIGRGLNLVTELFTKLTDEQRNMT